MGQGLTTFHEAKKFSHIPIPYAYRLITHAILVAEAIFVPFMLAANTRGYVSAFVFTFGGTCLLWFINGVAENLDNPYKMEASTLDTGEAHADFNVWIRQLISIAQA